MMTPGLPYAVGRGSGVYRASTLGDIQDIARCVAATVYPLRSNQEPAYQRLSGKSSRWANGGEGVTACHAQPAEVLIHANLRCVDTIVILLERH